MNRLPGKPLQKSLLILCLQGPGADNTKMRQSSLGLNNTVKCTRKREFLDAMNLVVPWTELRALIEPYAPESGRRGQQSFSVETMLRIHFMQQ